MADPLDEEWDAWVAETEGGQSSGAGPEPDEPDAIDADSSDLDAEWESARPSTSWWGALAPGFAENVPGLMRAYGGAVDAASAQLPFGLGSLPQEYIAKPILEKANEWSQQIEEQAPSEPLWEESAPKWLARQLAAGSVPMAAMMMAPAAAPMMLGAYGGLSEYGNRLQQGYDRTRAGLAGLGTGAMDWAFGKAFEGLGGPVATKLERYLKLPIAGAAISEEGAVTAKGIEHALTGEPVSKEDWIKTLIRSPLVGAGQALLPAVVKDVTSPAFKAVEHIKDVGGIKGARQFIEGETEVRNAANEVIPPPEQPPPAPELAPALPIAEQPLPAEPVTMASAYAPPTETAPATAPVKPSPKQVPLWAMTPEERAGVMPAPPKPVETKLPGPEELPGEAPTERTLIPSNPEAQFVKQQTDLAALQQARDMGAVPPEKYTEAKNQIKIQNNPYLAAATDNANPETIKNLTGRNTLADESGIIAVPTEKASEVWTRVKNFFTNADVGPNLPAGEAYAQGLGAVLPKDWVAGIREIVHFPKALERFGPQARAGWEAVRDKMTDFHQNLSGAMETLQPFADLPKAAQKKVSYLLYAAREASKQAIAEGRAPLLITDEVARKYGLNDAELEGFRSVRNYSQKALGLIEEGLLLSSEGIPNLETRAQYVDEVKTYIDMLRQMQYVPASRLERGYEVRIPKVDGEKDYVGFRASLRDARALRQEAEKFYGKKAEKIKPMEGQSIDASKMLPVDQLPVAEHFDPQKYTEAAKTRTVVGFPKHLISALLVPGYETNLAKSLGEYVSGLSHWNANKKFEPRSRRVVKDLQDAGMPTLADWIARYHNDMTKPMNRLDQTLSSVVHHWMLAAVPASGLVNATQTVTTTFPHIVSELAKAYQTAGKSENFLGKTGAYGRSMLGGAEKLWAESWTNVFDYLITSTKGEAPGELRQGIRKVGEKVGLKSFDEAHPDLVEVAKQALNKGLLDASILEDSVRMREGRPKGMTTQQLMMSTFSVPEKGLRLQAAFAGKKIADVMGLKGQAAIDYALKFGFDTQFDQSIANRPKFMRNVLGRQMFMYKSFAGNYYRFLRDHMNKRDWPAVAFSMGSMYGLAGLSGLPGVRELTWIAEDLGYDVRKMIREIVDDPDKADELIYGWFAKKTGAAIGGGVAQEILQDPTRGGPYGVLGPIGQKLGQVGEAFGLWGEDKGTKAVEAVGPRYAKNFARVGSAIAEGEVTTKTGKPLLKNPTTKDLVMMGTGVQNLDTAKRMEALNSRRLMQQRMANKPNFLDRYARAMIKGDNAEADRVLAERDAYNETADPADLVTFRPADVRRKMQEMTTVPGEDLQLLPKRARSEMEQVYKRIFPTPLEQ